VIINASAHFLTGEPTDPEPELVSTALILTIRSLLARLSSVGDILLDDRSSR
jgi:hypothetical protein